MIRVRFDPAQVKDLQAKLAKLVGPGADLRRPLDSLGRQVQAGLLRDFVARQKGRTVNGVAWAPISGVTALFRRKTRIKTVSEFLELGRGRERLVDKGLLRGSFSLGGANSLVRADRRSVEVGTTDTKAHVHQDGASVELRFEYISGGDLKLVRSDGTVGPEDYLSDHIAPKLGRKSNDEFWKLLHILRGMQGLKTVPKRPVVIVPGEAEITRLWVRTLETELQLLVNGMGGGP